MTQRRLVFITLMCVVPLMIFAIVRVRPYTQSRVDGRPAPEYIEKQSKSQSDESFRYDMEALRQGGPDLRKGLYEAASKSLRDLSDKQPLSQREIEQIVSDFAHYVTLARTGTHADYADWTKEAGRKQILPDNVSNADLYWDIRTIWARHEQLDPQSVQAKQIYLRGRSTSPPGHSHFDKSGPIRELPSGGYLFNSDHDHSAFEVSIGVRVPSSVNDEVADARVGLIFVDDAGRSWKPVLVVLHGVESSFRVALPPI